MCAFKLTQSKPQSNESDKSPSIYNYVSHTECTHQLNMILIETATSIVPLHTLSEYVNAPQHKHSLTTTISSIRKFSFSVINVFVTAL